MVQAKSFQSPLLLAASLVLAAFVAHPTGSPQPSVSPEIPAWFMQHMETAASGTGRWVADNAAYQSADETFTGYGVEWTWGIGKKSLTGRLYALQDGKDIGTLWQFRQFWHPGEQQAYLHQFGSDGTFGYGTIRSLGGTKTEASQVFYNPDGTTFRVGHRSEIIDGADQSASFDIAEDGTWHPRRAYVWRLVP